MAVTAGTVLKRPDRYEDFETNSVKLWKILLRTPNVQKNGRRGQPQKGVDLWGYRDRDINQPVGIQCKLKGLGKEVSEAELRDEWNEALKFSPPIKEYFLLTTADNDAKLEELARQLAKEQHDLGRAIEFYVWGWEKICDEVIEHPDLVRAFDNSWGPFAKEHSAKLDGVIDGQVRQTIAIEGLTDMVRRIGTSIVAGGLDVTSAGTEVEKVLDRQIDDYRDILQADRPRTALPLFEKMLRDVEGSASGRIIFRIKANIGSCHLSLENIDVACDFLLQAYEHAPDEPKAIANGALAYLLRGDFGKVLEIGREELSADRADEALWPHVVQAAAQSGFDGDPLSLVPERHHETEGVLVALVHFSRIIGNDRWRALAVHAHNLFPGNRYARQFYADSILDEVCRAEDGWASATVPSALKERLAEVPDIYRGVWDEATAGENVVGNDEYIVLANLLVALRLLNRFPDIAALIERERDHIERDPGTLLRATAAAYEAGSEIAGELFPLLQEGPEKAILKIQLLLRKADWNGLAGLDRAILDTVNEAERTVCRTALDLSRAWKSADGLPSAADLDPIIDAASTDARASILAADMCAGFGVPASSDRAWKNGRRAVTPQSHWTSRVSVAKHAFRRGRWRDAIEFFNGAIDLSHDSEELRQFAISVAYEVPQSGMGAKFFRDLPHAIRSDQFFKEHEALMLFHAGDLPRAEKLARDVLQSSRGLGAFRLLTYILRRSGRPEKIKALVNGNDILSFEGGPDDRMHVANILHEVGRIPEALKLMYELYMANRDKPELALGFFSMMMSPRSHKHVPRPRSVCLDAWVAAEDDNGHRFEFIVGNDPSQADGILVPTHAFAAAAMGKAVDETFTRPRDVGGDNVWTVREIRHRYSHAARDIGENFETRFPDAQGVYSFRMKDKDIQPMLDMVKQRAEANEQFAQHYVSDGLPLGFISARLHGDPISFADYVRSLGHDITTCIGLGNERQQAFDTIARHRAKGAVLDTYTAWTCAVLDLFPALLAVFGSLHIPQSVKDELLLFRGMDEPSEKSLSIVHVKGEYLKQEISRTDILKRRKAITAQIQKIEKYCTIVPVGAPPIDGDGKLERMEALDTVVENFGPTVFDAAALAADDFILLSEDMNYRRIAGGIWPIRSVWIQPVLTYAVGTGLISNADYASKVVSLARLRHSYVSLDGVTLAEIAGDGGESALDDFAAAAAFLGTQKADLRSHVGVIARFINLILLKKMPHVAALRAISIVLENLIREHRQNYPMLLVGVFLGCQTEGREFVLGWIKGHFLLPETEHAFREVSDRTLPYAIRSILEASGGLVGNLERRSNEPLAGLPKAFKDAVERKGRSGGSDAALSG